MRVSKKVAPIVMAGMMAISIVACGNSAGKTDMTNTKKEVSATKAFPKFQGKDFENNDVDESIFAENEVTLLNFWFNGCSACVNEMEELEGLNKKLKEKGAELIGVNVETGSDDKILEEAKNILSKQGASYRNISIIEGRDMKDYIGQIFAYPTTVMVDKNGNIIGEPIVGSIEDEKKIENILKIVDDIKAGKEVSVSEVAGNDKESEIAALIAEENNVIAKNQELWLKVFQSIEESDAKQLDDISYAEFLKTHIESVKESFSEDELKTLNEDIEKIAEIDKKIEELEKNKDNM